jgi:hypothetical protein
MHFVGFLSLSFVLPFLPLSRQSSEEEAAAKERKPGSVYTGLLEELRKAPQEVKNETENDNTTR